MSEVLEVNDIEKLSPITKVETEIVRMRNEFSGLKIKDVNDKDGFGKVTAARKEVKAIRVQVEKERKILVDDAVKWQRQVNEAAKDITGKLVEIEEPLQKMEDDHLAEKERVKQEAERLRKEKIQKRAQVITSFSGVNYNGLSYSLGEVAISQSDLELLADADFQTKVEAFEAEYSVILSTKLEAERIAKEEADRLEAIRVQQEAAAAELKRQQDELAAERKRLEDEKAEIEAAARREREEKEAQIRREQEAASEKEREENRIAELEAARKEAAEKALAEAEAKAKQEANAKAEADRITKDKEEKRLAKRPDIEKFSDMVSKVLEVVNSFEFKTEDGKSAKTDFLTGIELLLKTTSLTDK